MSDVTATVYDHTFFYSNYNMPWQGVIAQTLRGALRKSVSGDDIIYKDAWSGLTVTVTKTGQFVTGLVIEGPIPDGAGGMTDKVLVDASFDTGVLKAWKLKDVFNSYHATSGDDARIERMFDNFTYDTTTVNTREIDAHIFNPIITGGRGDDTFVFGPGPHSVYASAGNDSYTGGGQHNTISYEKFRDGLTLSRSGTELTVEKSEDESDTLTNFRWMIGSKGNDDFKVGLGNQTGTLYGWGGRDKLGGGSDADYLDGGNGSDVIWGRGGNDLLIGGNGNDRIIGGAGADIIVGNNGYGYGSGVTTATGGKGRDLFVLEAGSPYAQTSAMMVITDFRDGVDFLGLIGNGFQIMNYGSYGTNFDDLTIADSVDGAVISVGAQQIALVEGIDASDLTRRDFVEMLDVEALRSQLYYDNDAYFYY
ncbi:calcium-binding protein [Arenibacterium halophilum]|uniref:Calcium-binding protein n=1 Tax=Arenibacterium halophilum TaxID=2583821 RepID=A0ABY2X662_9RHOB|nr:calcium-binding protein [Arenibacterium halophilum]TMV11274.1 calcium-binding protein [Arenibacterium halophilum]